MSQASLAPLLEAIDRQRGRLEPIRAHLRGTQPAAYLSSKSRDALDARLSRLGINFPALVVSSLAERLAVTGFRATGADAADLDVWELWRRAGMLETAPLVHADRIAYGASFVTVWADDGRLIVTGDNPLTMSVVTDPATGDVLEACRRWDNSRGSHAVHYTPDSITSWNAPAPDIPASAGAWKRAGTIDNPFGVVPVVPFVRRERLDDHDGTSAVAPILDPTDALGKVLQDALVTSEYFARPRRWATGLEVEEDDDGNPIDPFANDRKLVSESPDTKFGQFNASGVDGYTDLIATFTQIIGALTGLPPHYLGLHGDQPANADSVRAAEAQLTARAYSEQRQMSGPWAQVVALMQAVDGQHDVDRTPDMHPIWRSPEVRTPGQAADSAVKLHQMGVPLSHLLVDPLGYEPAVVAQIMAARRGEMLDRAGTDLSTLTGG